MSARWLLLALALLPACQDKGTRGNSAPALTSATFSPGASASAIASASAGAPVVNPETELPRLLALTSELARVHADHGKQCGALVNALRTWNDEHGVELRAISPTTYGTAERNPAAQAQLKSDFERIMDTGMRCRTNPEFQRLRAELVSKRQ